MPNTAALEAFDAKVHERRQLRDLGARIFGDVHDDAPGPCPECPKASKCAAGGLACEQFALFTRFGGDKRWRGAPRQPSVAIYERLFDAHPVSR
jgi:hypothetical protein